MIDVYLGEIRLLPYLYNPKDWLSCEGQLLSIQSNQALFSLLGTRFGGDGSKTFGLPDLRGRAIMGSALGNSGQAGGQEAVALGVNEMPSHNHVVNATTQPAATAAVANGVLAAVTDGANTAPNLYGPLTQPQPIDPDSLTAAGNGQPHNNMQPYIGLRFCIATNGEFPST